MRSCRAPWPPLSRWLRKGFFTVDADGRFRRRGDQHCGLEKERREREYERQSRVVRGGSEDEATSIPGCDGGTGRTGIRLRHFERRQCAGEGGGHAHH